jgi:hypothetical protein
MKLGCEGDSGSRVGVHLIRATGTRVSSLDVASVGLSVRIETVALHPLAGTRMGHSGHHHNCRDQYFAFISYPQGLLDQFLTIHLMSIGLMAENTYNLDELGT